MPTAARQNMLPLTASVKVYYKRNTIVSFYWTEMSQTADFAKQRTFLVSFVNFVSAQQQQKKQRTSKWLCVFFFGSYIF